MHTRPRRENGNCPAIQQCSDWLPEIPATGPRHPCPRCYRPLPNCGLCISHAPGKPRTLIHPMNTILLQPTDVLFFRDGRPMEGSLAGHGAAWPLPHITNAALHAALHRGFPVDATELNHGESTTRYGDHLHRVVRRGTAQEAERHRRFGSLATAGPFPVRQRTAGDPPALPGDSPDTAAANQTWFLPRP